MDHVIIFLSFSSFSFFLRFIFCWCYCHLLLRVFVSIVLDMRCADFPFVAGHCVEQLRQVADSNPRGCVPLCVRCTGPLIIRALRWKCCQIQIYSVEMFGYRGNPENLVLKKTEMFVSVHTHCSLNTNVAQQNLPLGGNTKIELKNVATTSDTNGI